jgi:hypothetical protein
MPPRPKSGALRGKGRALPPILQFYGARGHRSDNADRDAKGCSGDPGEQEFAGISLEVCAAKGLDAYVAVDASGTFSETKRQAGLLRMLQAGVVLSDYATLMVLMV